jgi:dipeptidase E
MTLKLVSIGGGEMGRPGTKIETLSIDKEIISLSGKKKPRVLFIPTASNDSERYYDIIINYYGKKLGCKVDVLYLIKEHPSKKEIERKILESDIIYVGGGNTLKMLKLWRKLGVDIILKKVISKGIVLSGLSAGAICWFKYGNSDSLKFKDKRNPLIKVKGLNLIPIMACPHYDIEKTRRPSLLKMIKQYGGIAIALDNCSAIEIIEESKIKKYRILTSSKTANAYKIYRTRDTKGKIKVIEEKLPKDKVYRPFDELLKK